MALLFLLPLLLGAYSPMGSAAADSNCSYEPQGAAEWHQEISSFNLTSDSDNIWIDEFDQRDEASIWSPGGGDNIYNESNLKALRSDFHTSFTVMNDSSTGLRLNLTKGYRYTFCVVSHSEAGSEYLDSPLIDVYLLEEHDWSYYRNDYNMRLWEDRDLLNSIPPEWRDVSAWMPYRDVHTYESRREADFAMSLDSDEVKGQFLWFGEPEPAWMYLVIDGWDNMRDTDTPAPHRNFTVDISIMAEERLSLPNYTVSLVCCGLFLMLAATPLILHHKFQNAGLSPSIDSAQGVDLMPMLETAASREEARIAGGGAPPPPGQVQGHAPPPPT